MSRDRVPVPGKHHSRNVIGVLDSPRECLWILMAHADTVPPSPGAEDNASGVGSLVALAPRLRRCGRAATSGWSRPVRRSGSTPGSRTTSARARWCGACARAGGRATCAGRSHWTRSGAGARMWLRSPARRGFERRVLAAASASGLAVRWVADEGSGNSDHREFSLAGLVAGKLGVPDNPLRHTTADRAGRLREATFPRVRRLLEELLQTG